jgi:hypothetical protein
MLDEREAGKGFAINGMRFTCKQNVNGVQSPKEIVDKYADISDKFPMPSVDPVDSIENEPNVIHFITEDQL